MSNEPIVMENEGHERVEHCIRWSWHSGSVSYAMSTSSADYLKALLEEEPPFGIARGELMQHTVTTSPWEPVLPDGVLRLDQLGAQEYGSIRVAELGDGVVEGYNVVAFTDDPERAFAAVRAHFAMVYGEVPDLALRWEDEPVRWWQVFGNCGCGDTCTHIDGEDHDCVRWGLPPCRKESEDGAAWIGELCEPDEPGAVPFVEIEVSAFTTPDERIGMQRLLLREAEEKLGALIKACLATKTTLDKPYADAPETTPWKQFVERPAKDADFLRTEIRKALAWRTAGRAPTCAKCDGTPLPGTELCNLHTPLKGNVEVRGGGRS